MNLLEAFKAFLFSQSNKPTKVTVKNYLSDINHFIRWYENSFQKTFSPSLVTKQVIEDFKKNNQQIFSASTLERHLSSLRKFFYFLRLEGQISIDPFKPLISENQAPKDPWHLKDFKNYLYVYNASHLTIKNYLIDIKQFLAWAEQVTGANEAIDLKNADILNHVNSKLVEEYKHRLLTQAQFSPATINRKLSSLRKYLVWAQAEKLIKDLSLVPDNIAEQNQPVELNLPIVSPELPILSVEALPKAYSKIPPLRLAQKLSKAIIIGLDSVFINHLATAAEKSQALIWNIKGQPVFQKAKNIRIPRSITHEDLLGIKNLPKELYAPLEISTKHFPLYKKILFKLRYQRPDWYKKYHSYAVVHYFHFAVLIIFMAALGLGFYNGFFNRNNQNPALASVPTNPARILSFQGRLTDASDNPITSNTNLRFAIYNGSTASGSALLWQEVNNVAPDVDGIFNSILGNNTAIPSTLFSENNALWLGVTVENTPELTPRQQLATVAFASNSETLQGLLPITATAAGTTNVVLALDSSGNLTIGGTANPVFQASGGQFKLSGQPLLLTTNVGSNGNVQLAPDGLGKIDLAKPLINTSISNNISTARGAVEVDDLFAILASSSGQSAFTINQTGGGPLISASASGVAKFTVDNSGNAQASGSIVALSHIQTYGNLYGGDLYVGFDDTPAQITTYDTDENLTIDPNGVGTITLTGGITLSNFTTNGGILYTNGSGDISQTGISTSSQCLLGGTTPAFGSCATGGYWQLNLGAISPFSNTADLLIGDTASSTAEFAFTGLSSLTHQTQASISGQLIVMPNNGYSGRVGIGTTTPQAKLDVRGSVNSGAGTTGMVIDENTGYGYRRASDNYILPILTTSGSDGSRNILVGGSGGEFTGGFLSLWSGGGEKIRITSAGNVGIGTANTSPLATLDVRTNSGTLPVASISGRTSFAALVTNNDLVAGDLFTASSSSQSRFTIKGNGQLIANAYQTCTLKTDSTGLITCGTDLTGTGGFESPFRELSGAIVPLNSTLDFFIGGQSTTSAEFAVINVNGARGTQIASVSGSLTLDSTTTAIQTTNNRLLTIGGNTTGNIALMPNNGTGGNVGIGTTNPTYPLDVNGTARIGRTGAPGQNVQLNGGDVSGIYVTGNSQTAAEKTLFISNYSGEATPGTANAIQFNVGTSGTPVLGAYISNAGNFGINNTTPRARLDVTGDASVSADLSFRGASTAHLVNILDNGSLNFVTSPGGDAVANSRLFIQNTGNVGIGTTNPGNALDVVGTGRFSGGIIATGYASAGNSFSTSSNDIYIETGAASKNIYLRPNGTGDNTGLYTFATTGLTSSATGNSSFAGNVGIGTTAPTAKLDVNGSASIGGTLNFYAPAGSNYGYTTNQGALSAFGSFGGGRIVNRNTDFISGNTTGFGIYNNLSNGSVSISNIASSSGTPNSSARVLQVTYNGSPSTASPGFGGFNIAFGDCGAGSAPSSYSCYREGTRLMHRIWAKIPVGKTINHASNATGTGTTFNWITSQAGTGEWQEYIAIQYIGAAGSFSTTGFYYLSGGADVGINWFVALAEVRALDEALAVDRAPSLNVGYKTGVNVGWGEIYSTGKITSDSTITALSTANPGITVGNGTTGYFKVGGSTISDAAGNLTLDSDSNLVTLADYTTNGGVLYTNGSGQIAQTGTSTASQCLLGGTTPTFGSCGTGTGANFWTSLSGALYPTDSTSDLLIGSTATSSAEFAFTGLGLANHQTQASLSGNLIVMPNNGYGGNVGIGTTNPSDMLTLASIGTANIRINADTDNVNEADIAQLLLTQDSGVSTATFGIDSGNNLVIGSNSTTGPNIYLGTRTDGTSFVTSADAKLTILNAGNVGIGTTAPTALLDVAGTASIGGQLTFRNTFGTIQTTNKQLLTLGGATTGDIQFRPGDSSTSLYLQSGGNVGIGTTGPSATLEVYGASQTTAALTDAGVTTGMLALNSSGTGAGNGGTLTFGNSQSITAGSVGFAAIKGLLTNGGTNTIGDLAFSTRNAVGDTALTERMRILAGGNVGIGTTAPTALLDVAGAASVGGQLTFRSGTAQIQSTANQLLTIGGNTTGDIKFMPGNSSTSLYLQSTGNVGIGTTAPGVPLEVVGDVKFTPTTTSSTTTSTAWINTPVDTISLFLGDGVNTSGYANTSYSSDIRFNGASVAWGDMSYYPTGGDSGENGHFRFTINGSTVTGTPNAKVGVGELYSVGNVGIGTAAPDELLNVNGNYIRLNNSAATASLNGTYFTNSTGSNEFMQATGGKPTYSSGYKITPIATAATMQLNNQTAFNWYTPTGLTAGALSATLTPAMTLTGGNLGIGTTSPLATLDIRPNTTNGGTIAIASASGRTSFAALVTNNDLVAGDLFTASSSSQSRFTIKGNGQLIANAYQTCTLKTDSTGLFTCGTDLQASSSSPFTENAALGFIFENNNTEDFLLGGTASTTAKFAFLNMAQARGNQIASVSGSLTLDSATAAIQTTNKQLLTLGGATTGDIKFMPGNSSTSLYLQSTGNVGIGTTGPTQKLSVNGQGVFLSSTVSPDPGDAAGPAVRIGYNTAGDYGYITSNNTGVTGKNLILQPGNCCLNVGIGTTGPDRKLDVLDASNPQLRLTQADGTVYSDFQVDGSGNLTIDGTGTKSIIADDLQVTGNDILDSGAATRITLGATTTLTNTTTTLSGTSTLTASSLATFTTSATLALNGASTINTDQTSSLSLFNTVLTGTLNLAGAATTLNIGPVGATATSINLAGGSAATGCTVDGATGNLTCSGNMLSTQTTGVQGFWQRNLGALSPANINDDLLIGAISTNSSALDFSITGIATGNRVTASLSGQLIVMPNNGWGGNVGIGTTSPGFPLNFATAVGDKISLYGNAGVHWGFGIQSNLMQIHSDTSNGDIAFGYGTSAAFTENMRIEGTGNVGIGTTTPTALLHVNGGTTGGNAALIVNQTGNTANDIFTASASGTTQFKLTNAGSIYTRSFFDLDNSSFFLDPAATATSLKISGDASSAADLSFSGATTAHQVNILDNGSLNFTTSPGGDVVANSRLFIQQNGNIGIGIASPSRQLHVFGAGQALANITDAGNKGGTLYLQDSGSAGNNGGAVIFGASQGFFAGIKGLIQDGSSNTKGYLAFLMRTDVADTSLTEAMRLNMNGNLGIGTASPQDKLHIAADINANFPTADDRGQIRITGATNTNLELQLGFDTTDEYAYIRANKIGTGGRALSLQPDGGNVGIGTIAPARQLDIVGTGLAGATISATISPIFGLKRTNQVGQLEFGVSGGPGYFFTTGVVAGDSIIRYQNNAGTGLKIGNNDAGSPFVTIDNSGNVGIGTTEPGNGWQSPIDYKLAISNTSSTNDTAIGIELAGDSAASNPALYAYRARNTVASKNIVQSNDTLFQITLEGYDGAAYVQSSRIDFEVDGTPGSSDMPGRIRFSTTADGAGATTERMRIDNLGNVGIGTTGPKALLDIASGNTFTNASAGFQLLNGTIGSSAGNYSYPAEFNTTCTTNICRLMIAGYRAGTAGVATWNNAGFRIQLAVDNSYTTGTQSYVYLGTDTGSNPYVALGTSNVDRLSVNTNGQVFIGADPAISTNSGNIRFQTLFSSNSTAAAQIWNVHPNTGGTGGCASSLCHTALSLRLGVTGGNVGLPDRYINFANGIGFIIGKVQGNAAGGVAYATTGGDYAEWFEKANANDNFDYGDLVCISSNGKIVRCDNNNTNLLGVVSKNFGFVGNSSHDGDPNWVLIGLLGQIDTKINSDNGQINPGDLITYSSTPGIATKAVKPGYVIGRALETGSNGEINVYVNPTWYDPDVKLSSTGNLGIYDYTVGDPGYTVPHYFTLNDALGNPITRVGAFGELAVANLKAGFISAGQITTNALSVTSENISINGQGIRDYISGIVQDIINSTNGSYISPIASIDQLHTNLISPVDNNSKLSLDLTDSKLTIRNGKSATSSAVASIDNQGNATFSGSLAVGKDATIAGTLRATRIIADQIEGLNIQASTVSANYITNVTNIYNSTPSSFPTLSVGNPSNSGGGSSLFADLFANNSFVNIATLSSQLAYVENLNGENAVFNQGLMVFGPTTLSDTSVVGQLSVNGSLILSDNSINVLGGDLNLQPLRQGGLSVMSGLFYIDTDGNVSIKGDATINGTLYANIISPIPGVDLSIKLGTTSALQNQSLKIRNASNSAILSVNQFGDLVASGEAKFAKLNLNSLVAPALAVSSTEIVATGSAGVGQINSYKTEMTIDNPLVNENSLIYITPTSNTNNQVLFLQRQVTNKSFTVGVQNPSSQPIPFNWIIVN